MREIAIYDMDKTITKRPTLVPFLVEAVFGLHPWRALLLPLLLPCLAAYGLKLINRAQLKTAMQWLFLGHSFAEERVDPASRSFARKLVAKALKPGAVARIKADREAGRMLVLATASSSFYVDAIGELLEFDVVMGTEAMVLDSGRLSPRIQGGNCYGEGKLERIVDWLAREGIKREECRITFYSDHVSDMPSFLMADHPVPVDPDRKLATEAAKRGWTIERWG